MTARENETPRRDTPLTAVALTLGSATRALVGGIRRLTGHAADELATEPELEPIEPLLESLGELMARHGDGGYAALADDETLWRLVARLDRARRRRGRAEAPRRLVSEGSRADGAGDAAAASEDEAAPPAAEAPDVEAGEGGQGERASSRRKGKKKASSSKSGQPEEDPADTEGDILEVDDDAKE